MKLTFKIGEYVLGEGTADAKEITNTFVRGGLSNKDHRYMYLVKEWYRNNISSNEDKLGKFLASISTINRKDIEIIGIDYDVLAEYVEDILMNGPKSEYANLNTVKGTSTTEGYGKQYGYIGYKKQTTQSVNKDAEKEVKVHKYEVGSLSELLEVIKEVASIVGEDINENKQSKETSLKDMIKQSIKKATSKISG